MNQKKCTQTTFDELKDEFDDFKGSSLIENINRVFAPQINKMTGDTNQIMEEYQDMQKIVTQLDHALNLKANKTALTVLEEVLRQDLTSKANWRKMEQDIL